MASRRRKLLITTAAMVLALVAVVTVIWARKWEARRQQNYGSAVQVLQRVGVALQAYAKGFPATGYPASLTQLGTGSRSIPSCNNAWLLEDSLDTDVFSQDGYEFSYVLVEGAGVCHGGPDAPPGTQFRLVARPLIAGRTGEIAFTLDASGAIRGERDGRPLDAAEESNLIAKHQQQPPASPHAKGMFDPKPILTITSRSAWMAPVHFDHNAHAIERGLGCETCHHPPEAALTPEMASEGCRSCHEQAPAPAPTMACSVCHNKAVRAPMITDTQQAFHDARATSGLCIGCHQAMQAAGRPAPVECAQCHGRVLQSSESSMADLDREMDALRIAASRGSRDH